MVVQEDPELLFSHGHNKSIATWKLATQFLHNSGSEGHIKRGRQRCGVATTPPLSWWSTIGKDLTIQTSSLRNKGSVPHIRHLNPWEMNWRNESPKHLTLKTNMAFQFLENHRAVGNGDSILKGFHIASFTLGLDDFTNLHSWDRFYFIYSW